MPTQPLTIEIYRAPDLVATDGVMKGAAISFADELILDDIYQLRRGATPKVLPLIATPEGLQSAEGAGHRVHLDCCLTLMDPRGGTHEALILVEVTAGMAEAVYVMPLADMRPLTDYRVVGIARELATKRFADASAGSFAKGTRITLRDGSMCPIEALAPGDMVLTRDAGPQPVRQMTEATLRAAGSFAPVVIGKGVLNNDAELVVRPDHRLFIYQRQDHIGAGRGEVLVRARHLVDGKKITRRMGGFIDYYQIVFDDHHIIFAEGIAAESHLVDPRTRGLSSEGMSDARHSLRGYHAYEVADHLLSGGAIAEVLRPPAAGR